MDRVSVMLMLMIFLGFVFGGSVKMRLGCGLVFLVVGLVEVRQGHARARARILKASRGGRFLLNEMMDRTTARMLIIGRLCGPSQVVGGICRL